METDIIHSLNGYIIVSTDRIGEIEALQAIAETLSFSEAAKRLGVSQSSISRRVGALEARLENRTLVARTTREVHLTEAGRTYLRLANAALEQLHAAEQHVLENDHDVQGMVRMSLPPAIGRSLIVPQVHELLTDYPKLKVELDFTERYVDFFQDQIDLAIRIRRTEQSGIHEEQIGEFSIVLVSAPSYVKKLRLRSPDQLKKARFISPRRQHAPEFEDVLKSLDVAQDRIQLYVDDVASVRGVLKEGYGVGFLPEILVREDLKEKRLISLDFGKEPSRMKLYASYPYEYRNSRRIELVLSRIKQATSGPS